VWLATGSATRELRDGEIVVGGGADADWRVTSADLMPRHFTLLVHGLNAQLRPTSAESVVVVNGAQLDQMPYVLHDGDEILAGSGRFVFSEHEPRTVPESSGTSPRGFLIDDSSKVSYELNNRSTTIGRDPSNAILVGDPTASRFHAEVRREAGGFALHSMGSAGTTVNDKRVTAPVLLHDDDIIEVAFTRLRFSRDATGTRDAAALSADRESLWSRRNPTLATSKIWVVEPDRERHSGVVWLVVAIVVIVAAAVLFLVRGH
jgi:pSer/pThr/pTyr-binding forkhead associated (FHA) protein